MWGVTINPTDGFQHCQNLVPPGVAEVPADPKRTYLYSGQCHRAEEVVVDAVVSAVTHRAVLVAGPPWLWHILAEEVHAPWPSDQPLGPRRRAGRSRSVDPRARSDRPGRQRPEGPRSGSAARNDDHPDPSRRSARPPGPRRHAPPGPGRHAERRWAGADLALAGPSDADATIPTVAPEIRPRPTTELGTATTELGADREPACWSSVWSAATGPLGRGFPRGATRGSPWTEVGGNPLAVTARLLRDWSAP